MTIEIRYKVGDLVHYKYYRPSNEQRENDEVVVAYEIVDIETKSCYAGTQIFYTVRSIHCIKFEGGEFFLPGHLQNREYQTFREDELKECSEIVKKMIIGL